MTLLSMGATTVIEQDEKQVCLKIFDIVNSKLGIQSRQGPDINGGPPEKVQWQYQYLFRRLSFRNRLISINQLMM